jgi:hypothetical protein
MRVGPVGWEYNTKVPKNLYNKGFEYLTPHFKNVVKEFEEEYGNKVIGFYGGQIQR